jgi:hypothetical protein
MSEDLNTKVCKEVTQFGMKMYMKLVMIMEFGVVNCATSKNLTVKCTMFPHLNIHKYASPSPDGETHSQIDSILIDRQRHSITLDVHSFRIADCDTDHYLAMAKVRERLAVNKQNSHRFQTERFSLKNLKEVVGNEQYHVDLSNIYAFLEDLDA